MSSNTPSSPMDASRKLPIRSSSFTSSIRKGDVPGTSSIKNAALDRRRQRVKVGESTAADDRHESRNIHEAASMVASQQQNLKKTMVSLPREQQNPVRPKPPTPRGDSFRVPVVAPKDVKEESLSTRRLGSDAPISFSSSNPSLSLQSSRQAGEQAAAFLGSHRSVAGSKKPASSASSTTPTTTTTTKPAPMTMDSTDQNISSLAWNPPSNKSEDRDGSALRPKQRLSPDTALLRRIENINQKNKARPTNRSNFDTDDLEHIQRSEFPTVAIPQAPSFSREDSDGVPSKPFLPSTVASRTDAETNTTSSLKPKRNVLWNDVSPSERSMDHNKLPPKPGHLPMERSKPTTPKYDNKVERHELFEDDAVMVHHHTTPNPGSKLAQRGERKSDSDGKNDDLEEEEMNHLSLVKTVEEVEPQIDRVHPDAACLENKSMVRLQPYDIWNRLIDVQTFGDEVGPHLPPVPCHVSLYAVGWSAPVLCYGDCVELRATRYDDKYRTEEFLGVVEATNQVCFLKKQSDIGLDMLLWQVFRGDSSTHLIRVGSSITEYHRNDAVTAPIHSGDPVLLRHVVTGGLLSFFSGEWIILTDSYQQEEEPTDLADLFPKGHTLPLNRLRDHNLIIPSLREIFTFVLDEVPWTTAWIHGGPLACRKYLMKTHLRFPKRHEQHEKLGSKDAVEMKPLASLRQHEVKSVSGQEQVLVEELLGSFQGLEGTFLRAYVFDDCDSSIRGQQLQFHLENSGGNGHITRVISFDRGLSSLVEGLLPISDCFVLVEEFVATRMNCFEYGTVMQSLCACLDRMMDDYMVSITGIEDDYRKNGTMSLRELQVVCQPLMDKLSVLRNVAFTAVDKKGGALINGLRHLLLHEYQGNTVAESILQKLLEEAGKPFMSMLQNWLTNGVLEDPYREFMVQIDDTASEWWCKYVLDDKNTLQHFFPTPIEVQRTLATGKYWNVVRACQETTLNTSPVLCNTTSPDFVLQYHANGAEVASFIQNLHTSASQDLLNLLMDHCELMGALRLLKRYFLLDHGDFFLTFLDAAEEELSREPDKLRQFRVEHLLQVTVQITESNICEDSSGVPQRKQKLKLSPADLTCRFTSDSLLDQLDRIHSPDGGLNPSDLFTPKLLARSGQGYPSRNGVDLFLLELSEVPFPLSLILSESSLNSYRLLFRHLFFAKHVERKLVSVWRDHLAMKEFTSIRGAMGSTHLLRHKMLHCVQNLIYYMAFEVIEPNFNSLVAKVGSSSTLKSVDEIIVVHREFLDQTLDACFLTNRDFVLDFTRVMHTCLLFSRQMETFSKQLRLYQDRQPVDFEGRNRIQRSRTSRNRDSTDALATLHKQQVLERNQRVQELTRRVEREVANPDFQSMISHYESTFDKHLRAFMNTLSKGDDKYHTQKVNLCIRLDYNGYVNSVRQRP